LEHILFSDRVEAGRRLSELYDGPRRDVVVLGIARGGVAVGYPVAVDLGAALDVVTARKLPIPWSPEMGFGAIAPDGSTVLNERLLPTLGLSGQEIEGIKRDVLGEVRRRERVYRGGLPPADIKGKNVVLVDDGLATGYTMVSSSEMVKNQKASQITVAVPVSPQDTARRIEPMADRLLVIHVAGSGPFAVASFYEDFHDMEDTEVLDFLRKANRAETASG
jgi:putative phosphoribosyl transferase